MYLDRTEGKQKKIRLGYEAVFDNLSSVPLRLSGANTNAPIVFLLSVCSLVEQGAS